MFIQVLLNGVISGIIYFLIASGFSIIYATNRFIYFTHGAVIALAAYLFYQFSQIWNFNLVFSSLLVLIVTTILGCLINFLFFQPLKLKKSSSTILLLASVSLMVLIESVILIIFGAGIKDVEIANNQVFRFLTVHISLQQILIISLSLVVLIIFHAFIKYSRIGKAMRAVTDNPELAEIVGISNKKIYLISFVIGSGLAGLAGVAVGLEYSLQPQLAGNLMVKGFTGAVVGGLGSVPGAFFGSILLGLAENIGIWFLPSGFKDAIAFAILFLILFFRPQGLWPKIKLLKNA